MEVVYSDDAIDDFLRLEKYITKFGHSALQRFYSVFEDFEVDVVRHPKLYPSYGDVDFKRRAVLLKQLIVYYVFFNQHILVLRIQDAREDKDRTP